MKFRYVSDPALKCSSDLLAVCVAGDVLEDPLVVALDAALGGHLLAEAKAENFKGKADQTLHTYTRGALPCAQIVLLGAGDPGQPDNDTLRNLGGVAARVARRASAKTVTLVAPSTKTKRAAAAVQLLVEGFVLGSYRFSRYVKGEAAEKTPVTAVDIALDRGAGGKKKQKGKTADADDIKAAVARGQTVGKAVLHARDLVNEPAAAMTPTAMADEAKRLADKHKSLTLKVLGPKECAKLGMGMFLGVGQGSDQEPRLVHLIYKPAKKAKKRIALIGKGVTFDSGGYSLKPSQAMEDMKVDMAGSAAVIAAMGAIAELGSPHEIHAIAALAENLVSGRAYKLGDVLEAMDGTTVEINNTDAEGRLTLGDALAYARDKIEPDEILDFATLTGACMVALGMYTAAVMSDHEPLIEGWMAACADAGEDVWRLPLHKKLKEQLKSPIADMRNTGERWGGAITAGLFLKHFAKDTPWVHTDIAGPATSSRDSGAYARGGTGFGVAAIVEYVTR